MYQLLKQKFLNIVLLNSIIFCSSLSLEEKNKPKKESVDSKKNPPNNNCSINPFEGLSTFIFFPMIPTPSKERSDKINDLLKKEIEKYGKVSRLNLIVDTKKGQAIDLSPLKGASLTYKIENPVSLDGEPLPFIIASLTLGDMVRMIETKKTFYSSTVWSKSCFINGDLDKELESLVSKSFNYLLKEVLTEYSAVNSDKPVFNLYIP